MDLQLAVDGTQHGLGFIIARCFIITINVYLFIMLCQQTRVYVSANPTLVSPCLKLKYGELVQLCQAYMHLIEPVMLCCALRPSPTPTPPPPTNTVLRQLYPPVPQVNL